MKRHCAFTLIELAVTLLVLGVLVAIALPAWRETMQRNRMAAATNELVTALQMAKSEAVKQGRRVAVWADGAGWVKGWRIVWDFDNDENIDSDDIPSSDTDTNQKGQLKKYIALPGGAAVTAGSTTQVVFISSGAATSGAAFTVSLPDAKKKGCVNVSASGSIHSELKGVSESCS